MTTLKCRVCHPYLDLQDFIGCNQNPRYYGLCCGDAFLIILIGTSQDTTRSEMCASSTRVTGEPHFDDRWDLQIKNVYRVSEEDGSYLLGPQENSTTAS